MTDGNHVRKRKMESPVELRSRKPMLGESRAGSTCSSSWIRDVFHYGKYQKRYVLRAFLPGLWTSDGELRQRWFGDAAAKTPGDGTGARQPCNRDDAGE